MRMQFILAALPTTTLLFSALAFARVIESWEYERLFKESDLIVIAVAEKNETANDEPPKHVWPLEVVAQNTIFKPKHALKGKVTGQEIKVLHFRFEDKLRKGEKATIQPIQIVDGPFFVEFRTDSQAEYLL